MSLDKDEDPMQQLVDNFHTLMDESLVYAIANDYDLHTYLGYQAAWDTLQSLSANVPLEEATGFNPSGTSGPPEETNNSHPDDASTSVTSLSHQGSGTRSSSTDISFPIEDAGYACPRLTSFNNASDETKIRELQCMFSELKEFDVKNALKKNGGDFQGALDHLLNLQYFEDSGQRGKGVDTFFQPEELETAPKDKKSRKKWAKTQADAGNNFELLPKQTKNIKHDDEIAFLADRIDCLSYEQISQTYFNKKCSSGAAAVGILDQYIELGIMAEDKEGKAQAKELGSKYRNIPEKYLLTLVHITRSPSHFSDDIAALLSKHFAKYPYKQRLDLTHRTTPLPDQELESALSLPSNKARTAGFGSTKLGIGSSFMDPISGAQIHQKIDQTYHLKRNAKSHAAQLSRRAGPLYKAAAHVYRERAHEHASMASALTSSAADYHVSQNSTAFQIDLHGVSVRDGVRIAKVRVAGWWEGLGEFQRARKAKENVFTVVTGLGKHSAGGVSQLRKAVAAALMNEGWKIEVETGKFVVTGRR